MWLRKEYGGCSVGTYEWVNDGDVVEVDDKTGADLLAIKGGGYTPADPPKLSAKQVAAAKAAADAEAKAAADAEAAKTAADAK
jgi:hypothetical protein